MNESNLRETGKNILVSRRVRTWPQDLLCTVKIRVAQAVFHIYVESLSIEATYESTSIDSSSIVPDDSDRSKASRSGTVSCPS